MICFFSFDICVAIYIMKSRKKFIELYQFLKKKFKLGALPPNPHKIVCPHKIFFLGPPLCQPNSSLAKAKATSVASRGIL